MGPMLGLILGSWLSLAWGRPGVLDDAWKEIRYRGRTHFVVAADSARVKLHADASGTTWHGSTYSPGRGEYIGLVARDADGAVIGVRGSRPY